MLEPVSEPINLAEIGFGDHSREFDGNPSRKHPHNLGLGRTDGDDGADVGSDADAQGGAGARKIGNFGKAFAPAGQGQRRMRKARLDAFMTPVLGHAVLMPVG